MAPTISDFCLSTSMLHQYFHTHQNLLLNTFWEVEERLWIYQLDKDGFIVSRIKTPPRFLKALSFHKVDYIATKDESSFYYVALKTYLNKNPNIKFTSYFRSGF